MDIPITLDNIDSPIYTPDHIDLPIPSLDTINSMNQQPQVQTDAITPPVPSAQENSSKQQPINQPASQKEERLTSADECKT